MHLSEPHNVSVSAYQLRTLVGSFVGSPPPPPPPLMMNASATDMLSSRAPMMPSSVPLSVPVPTRNVSSAVEHATDALTGMGNHTHATQSLFTSPKGTMLDLLTTPKETMANSPNSEMMDLLTTPNGTMANSSYPEVSTAVDVVTDLLNTSDGTSSNPEVSTAVNRAVDVVTDLLSTTNGTMGNSSNSEVSTVMNEAVEVVTDLLSTTNGTMVNSSNPEVSSVTTKAAQAFTKYVVKPTIQSGAGDFIPTTPSYSEGMSTEHIAAILVAIVLLIGMTAAYAAYAYKKRRRTQHAEIQMSEIAATSASP
ncbi:MAG: uncharacterized protein KVP18_000287 [Porospora cf. gigantea A]|uniref:uncharacterized protein n=1 Tax=Porospora cf. gigantea A TaxID=2853593 RepID=UPI00355A8E36|nr:MAG: hypothetical protein KVP18_000287 [Porospora cf. gigantea A]